MAISDWRLAAPTFLWFVGYIFFLRHFVPRMRDLAKTSSEARSHVLGRIVDSYTNILTVKLFARLADEDAYVREVIDEHQDAMGRAHAAHLAVHVLARGDERGAAHVHRGDRHLAVGERHAERGRRRDRAAARVADRRTSRAG